MDRARLVILAAGFIIGTLSLWLLCQVDARIAIGVMFFMFADNLSKLAKS